MVWQGITSHRIDPDQVTCDEGCPGHEFLGSLRDGALFVIVHTADPQPDDLLHEVLHAVRSDWSEDVVTAFTNAVLPQ